MLKPTNVTELQSIVREGRRLTPRGSGTKAALATPAPGSEVLDLSQLRGVLEYNPGEYTFTALAGTPIHEVQAMLAEHGQYLPFDPLFAERGATLGGTVASGLSGPGRYRYGGVRDFILGIKMIDGRGEVVRGGGKVVKNSAGFDLPKLMVGSLGSFGVLTELTFKVFPAAPAHITVTHSASPLASALEALGRIYTARMEIDSLDFAPDGAGLKFWVRLAGLAEGLPARAERVRTLLGGGEVLYSDEEAKIWQAIRSFDNISNQYSLVKVPISPKRVGDTEEKFGGVQRHYSVGGNVVWLKSQTPLPALHETLCSLGLAGLVVFGSTEQVRLGVRNGQALESRVKQVFDPAGIFPNH